MNDETDMSLLAAYADGELDEAQRTRVEQMLLERPELAEEMLHLRALRSAVGEKLRVLSPGAPLPLRENVRALFDQSTARPVSETRQARRYWPIALAAGIAIFLGIAALLRMTGQSGAPVSPAKNVVVVDRVRLASRIDWMHNHCSELSGHSGNRGFPHEIGSLAPVVREFIGHDAMTPDLSSLGYFFEGAAACTVPGGKTLHLLYRTSDVPAQHVSVFAQDDQGQLDAAPDKVFVLSGDGSGHPILAFRDGVTVYYLIADNYASLRSTCDRIGHPAPAD